MRRLFLLAFIWGWSFLFIKVAVDGMSPPTVACFRVGLGALTLHAVLRIQGRRLPTDRETWTRFTIVALLGSSLPFTMLAWGEERITSASTAVLNASTPLFTALAAAVVLREKLRSPQIAGLVLGLGGVAVAAGFGGADLADSSVAGSLAAIFAGASYGLAFVYMRRHLTGIPPVIAATGQLTMATALLLPFAVATSVGEGIRLTPTRVLAVALLGVVGTGAAYILNYGIVGELGPTKASLVTYIIPVVAVAVGVLALDEQFEARLLAGGVMIVAGIALVNERLLARRRAPRVRRHGRLMAADAWGIEDGYWDIAGHWHDTPPETSQALRVAMGGHADVADPPPRSRPVWFVRLGTSPAIERPADLVLEDGSQVEALHTLPPDLPLGYHELHPSDGGPSTRLIVTPPRCHLPADLHGWAWTVQLYAARSTASWGFGDLGDLRRLATWSAGLGARMLAVSPLHAVAPLNTQEPSPYFPSSRRYRNPLYIRIEEVPGYDPSDPVLATASEIGRGLNAQRRIERDHVWDLKRSALGQLWAGFLGDPAFERYLVTEGTPLRQYATFCTLVEHYGACWSEWPPEHRRPDGPGVIRFAALYRDRVRFHAWLQWLLDEQLARAAAEIPILHDLAVGVDADGADGWVWQEVFAPGVRVGAPPDEFNADGQDWGFPPFVPWRLRSAGYEPFVQTLRASLRHAGALRIDHVMGLFRLFWIPPDGEATEGAYVRYPGTELLDIVALESVRAGAVIVGEDLGTVEDQVRADLHDRGVLSYRLLWFEPDPPERFPSQALAAVTTHDLPTIAGLWSGRDFEAQREIGLEPSEQATSELRARLVGLTGIAGDAPAAEVVTAAYQRLARAPSMLVTATLDDALLVEERPNMPGTIDTWPNWSIALPVPLEEVEVDAGVRRVAAALDGRETLKPPAD